MTNLAMMALWVGVAHARPEVSSFKKESRLGANYWNASSALDANPETCWQTNPEAQNVGSWIAIDTPSATIDKLGMIVGWDVDEPTFKDYARIKSAKVEIFQTSPGGEPELKAEASVSFKDERGYQVVELPNTRVGGEMLAGGRVKITVTAVYPGKDFPNIAVSEVRVQLEEFEAGTLRVGTPPASGNAARLVDGSSRTAWVSDDTTAKFTLQAPGYGLASLGLVQAAKTYARPKTIKVTANDNEATHTLADRPGVKQTVLLPYIMGYTGGSWGDIGVEVVDTYPGSQEKVAIGEVSLQAGSIEDL